MKPGSPLKTNKKQYLLPRPQQVQFIHQQHGEGAARCCGAEARVQERVGVLRGGFLSWEINILFISNKKNSFYQ